MVIWKKNSWKSLFIKQCYCIVWSVEKKYGKNLGAAKAIKRNLIILLRCVVCETKKECLSKN